jgi:glycine/D-amino acid oxidase-like deaminating enzyme
MAAHAQSPTAAGRSFLADTYRQEPYWWKAAPPPSETPPALPRSVETVVIGSGITGCSCALTLAQEGCEVLVLDAHEPGYGASSRNAGFVGKTLKHSLASLIERHGLQYAKRVYAELDAAYQLVARRVADEDIHCHYTQCGRFMAAHSSIQYEQIARDLALKEKHLGEVFEMVPKAQQHREIGSEQYQGGAVIPELAAVHPGLYQLGLLDAAKLAGAVIVGHTAATQIEETATGVRVHTHRGIVAAGQVVVATNGYTAELTPWLQRRVVPFRAYMVATEPLAETQLAEIFPHRRTVHDYNNNLVYMRAAPDESRLLLGAKTGSATPDLISRGGELHAIATRLFPTLEEIRIDRIWDGYCAGTFDLMPHLGRRGSTIFALGYCFAGVPMGTYLGDKAARLILGQTEAAESVFSSASFPTRIWYRGNPWFVPWMMRYYDWQDRRSAA